MGRWTKSGLPFSRGKIIHRRRNPMAQSGRCAGEHPEAPEGRSSDSRGVAPRSVESGGDDRNSVHNWVSVAPSGLPGGTSVGLGFPGVDTPGYGRPPLRGFRPLSRALASLMDGVASTVNNLAPGEGGLATPLGKAQISRRTGLRSRPGFREIQSTLPADRRGGGGSVPIFGGASTGRTRRVGARTGSRSGRSSRWFPG